MLTTLWDVRFHARFNANLHDRLSTRYHRLSLASSVIATLAASSTLAATFQTGALGSFWQILLALAAVSAALGPIMRWTDLQAQHSTLALGYRQLEWRLDGLTVEQANVELARLTSLETHPHPIGWEASKRAAEQQARREFQISTP